MIEDTQAECLYQIVELAEQYAQWTNNRCLQIPPARTVAARLYPEEDPDKESVKRKVNQRIRALGKYIPTLLESPRTIDPEGLVTHARTAFYMLTFQRLRMGGSVSKEHLHHVLLSEKSDYVYTPKLLEEIFDFACDHDYIYLPARTTPETLNVGKALTDQLLYLKILVLRKSGRHKTWDKTSVRSESGDAHPARVHAEKAMKES